MNFYGNAWLQWYLLNEERTGIAVAQLTAQDPLRHRSEINALTDRAGTDLILRTPSIHEDGFETQEDAVVAASVESHNLKNTLGKLNMRSSSIALGEENIFWHHKHYYLSALYKNLKSELPESQILQWYSPSKVVNAPGLNKWPKLPADGWIFNQYTMSHQRYKTYVEAMKNLELPLFSILWASPNWHIGSGTRKHNDNFWRAEGRDRFFDQLSVNVVNGVTSAFFCFVLTTENKPVPPYQPLGRVQQSKSTSFVGDLIEIANLTSHSLGESILSKVKLLQLLKRDSKFLSW